MYVFHLNRSFYFYEMSLLILGNTPCFKVYFNISIVMLVFVCLLFAWFIFLSFYFQLVCAFIFKICLLQTDHQRLCELVVKAQALESHPPKLHC